MLKPLNEDTVEDAMTEFRMIMVKDIAYTCASCTQSVRKELELVHFKRISKIRSRFTTTSLLILNYPC